ncbi:hypothetical protein QE385_003977 [Sphingomonas sp. SORGH_AS 950]|uniref:hypothetical protein n=1 Tax=Sphingomonas sp. SORGH_AS_0950 TaxID=3041792 RepID=UPI00277DBC25|nr:hypothetical protein [Sphingomonas sp. SORGH_AS_0950]MDQ1159580.1 hypothetical protein [Sphingomonas sp. SORGH_AS_0950]
MTRVPPRRRPASREASHVIEMMLGSDDPAQVKTGLQRACEIFEGGQAFTDPTFLKIGLAAHLSSRDLKVRRWAYKLAALLRDTGQIGALETALLGGETDLENRGWASAAFNGVADEDRRTKLNLQLEDYRGTSLELAAKLYARGEPARDDLNISAWQKHAITRKWLCLLCGYAKDNARTIDQRYADLDLVRNCAFDDDRENVEYSVWAEHRHPAGSFGSLLRTPQDLLDYPNVRRWVYRLITKTADAAQHHLDLLTAMMNAANEPSDLAREGLALGLATIALEDRRMETIDWYSTEASPRVKIALVDHLALLANTLDDAVARDVLTADYSRYGPDDIIGAKIFSVAKPDWRLAEVAVRAPLPRLLIEGPANLFDSVNAQGGGNTFIYVAKQEIYMGNKIEQSGSGNVISGNVLGDAIQSTINTLNQQPDQNIKELTPLVETFLRALAASDVDQGDKELAVKAAEDAAKATGDERKGKWQTLKGVVRGMLQLPGMAAGAIEGGEKLVAAIQHVV